MNPRLLLLYKTPTIENPEMEREIIRILSPFGRLAARREWTPAPADRIAELYSEHRGQVNPDGVEYYPFLCRQFDGKNTVTYVFEGSEASGEEWVNFVRRKLIGDKDPFAAADGTYRNLVFRMTGETMLDANREGRAADNGVHCSDSVESGVREAGIFYWDHILDREKIENPEEATTDMALGTDFARTGKGIFFEERLENRLRDLGIVKDEEVFISYRELPVINNEHAPMYGWFQRSSETYTAAGGVELDTGKRRFIAKACIKLTPVETIEEWMRRRRILEESGVAVPEIYATEPGTYYEQYLEFTAEDALKAAGPEKGKRLAMEMGRIARAIDENFGFPRPLLADIRSDGEHTYFTDFGEDLGPPGKSREHRMMDMLKMRLSGKNLEAALNTYEGG